MASLEYAWKDYFNVWRLRQERLLWRPRLEESITTSRKMLSLHTSSDHTREGCPDHRSTRLHWIVFTMLWASVPWSSLVMSKYIVVGLTTLFGDNTNDFSMHAYKRHLLIQSAHNYENLHWQPPVWYKYSLLPWGCAVQHEDIWRYLRAQTLLGYGLLCCRLRNKLWYNPSSFVSGVAPGSKACCPLYMGFISKQDCSSKQHVSQWGWLEKQGLGMKQSAKQAHGIGTH